MKYTFTLKSPHLSDEIMGELDSLADVDEWEKLKSLTDKFFKHKEYAKIELDTDTGEARVLEA